MSTTLALATAIACVVHAGPRLDSAPVGHTAAYAAPEWLDVGGDVGVMALWLPRLGTVQLRPRIRGEVTIDPATWLRLYGDGVVEGLLDDRRNFGSVEDHSARVREAWIQVTGNRADFRAGWGRLVWGRLDEVQPSDVINPLDLATYLLEGRSEARRPVAFLRGRVYPVDGLAVEAVVLPRYESGVFDELDEASSPFNLFNDVVLPAGVQVSTPEIERRDPEVGWRDPLGGVRVSATLGRVDVSGAVFEGADGFGVLTFEPQAVVGPAVVGSLVETASRFRMYAADFETVSGAWALRGEMAYFADRMLAGVSVPGPVKGRMLEAGAGFDRRLGDLRVYGLGLYSRSWSEQDPGIDDSSLNLVGSVERSLARDTHLLRAFTVVNPRDGAAFVRGLWSWSVADNVNVEVSAGAFLGTSDDALGRFKGRDFVFSRLTYAF